MIREFQPDDLEACVHLLITAYNGEPWNNHWTVETATRYLNEFVSNENFVGFVICESTTIVGAMFAHRKTWWTKDELFVDEVYITPRLQRQGYGTRLLAHAEGYAKASDLAGLTLLTNRYMPATGFYAKHGYVHAEHVAFMYKELQTDHKPASEPMPVTRILFDGSGLERWRMIAGAANYHLEHGEIVVHNPAAQGAGLHLEAGGKSWDNYRVSLEVMAETETSYRVEGMFPWNVQICPHDSLTFQQLFGDGSVNACYLDLANKSAFVHAVDRTIPRPALNQWHHFEVEASEGEVELSVDGSVISSAHIPTGTVGALGLLVNFASDAKARIRDIRITFAKPTPEQLAEFDAKPTSQPATQPLVP